jgi:hypothetical protein
VLFSVATRCPIDVTLLRPIEKAIAIWSGGDRALAQLRLTFSPLPHLREPADVARLNAAAWLLDHGVSAHDLAKELGLSGYELLKFDPNQPRVPAGHGRESGEWTKVNSAEPSAPHLPIIFVAGRTPGGFTYDNKIEGQMKSRKCSAEQIDEAVKSGYRIDASKEDG